MISFIIPTYNRVHSISDSVQSIINQTSPYWELIIVDDGSIDETVLSITPYLIDERIKLISQKNQGVSMARNNGALLAKGDYLIFLDSDDNVEDCLVQTLIDFKYQNYDLINWSLHRIIDGHKKVVTPENLGAIYKSITSLFLAGSVCYSVKIFREIGGYDPKLTFGENYELGLRICQLPDLKVLTINKVLATYIIENNKRTSNSIPNRLYSLLYYFNKHEKLYQQNRNEYSKLHYQLGYLLEKANKKKFAILFYRKSWKISPWKIKPLIKINHLKFLKRKKKIL